MAGVIVKKTFCRVCEPMCGLEVQIDAGRVEKVRGSTGHVLSRGHLCAKAQAAAEVSYDIDRVKYPLKRGKVSGKFDRISWEQAIEEISSRLQRIQQKHGPESVATYSGNPTGFSAAALIWWGAFKKLLGVKWAYGVAADDVVAPMVASHFLYGSLGSILKPDLWRTEFVLVMGANPFVSHSSLFTEPALREAFSEVKKRGGRILVIDPRRTETAKKNEHVSINAGTDAYLLLAMLHTIFEEKLQTGSFLEDNSDNAHILSEQIRDFTPEFAAIHTGIDPAEIRQLAKDFAMSRSACVVGRTGTCTQRFGTLTNMLQNILCLVTGNVDVEGGMLFGDGLFDFGELLEASGANVYAGLYSRTTGQVGVADNLPSTALPSDILVEGDEQVRALFTIAANPMLSSPVGGALLGEALEALDLHVSIDCYVNETNRYADYVLPATTMYEREDIPLFAMSAMLRPSIWATEAVADAQGEARQEWQILNDLCRKLGFGGCYESKLLRLLARLGYQAKPKFFFDMIIRTSPWGDKFGIKRSGLSFKKLVQKYPDGYRLMEFPRTGVIRKKMRTKNGRVNLGQSAIIDEIVRLRSDAGASADYPYLLIGQREMLSQNSWLHNVETTMREGREQTVKLHPEDAREQGFREGDKVRIESRWGAVEVKVKFTRDMKRGNIALPHGWGHQGGWGRANRAGGVNSNILASDNPADTERISGGSIFNGIPVRLSSAA